MREHEGNLIEDDRSGKGGDRLSHIKSTEMPSCKKNRDLDHPTDASGPTYARTKSCTPLTGHLWGPMAKPL